MILHTNLGRAPWPAAARVAAMAGASGYGYLELDEATGRRGPRFPAAEEALCAVTGAEAGLVVTNNAAALLLAVGLAGRSGAVVVSRGELVEIGGGVRIPEVVARAGARLVEVGTTNRTRAADFEAPLAEGKAKLVLRVHPSNFAISGFTEAADLAEVAAIAHRHGADRGRRPGLGGAAGHDALSGSPTSRCPPSAWPPAPTSCCSAATSWSAGRRRG